MAVTPRDFATDRLDRGQTPAVILAEMETAFPDPPSRRTLYRWIRTWKDARALDTSGKWRLASDETGRPDIVMRVLASLVSGTRALTIAEARWIVRLGTSVPELVKEPISLRLWARRYLDATLAGEETSDLDATLAGLFYGAERIS